MERWSFTKRWNRQLHVGLAAAVAVATVLVVASPSQASSRGGIKIGGTVTIDNVQGNLWPCQFNPYGSSSSLLSAGIIYEPLWYINQDNNKGHAWLATRYAWSHGNKKLTFTLRSGVKFTDGKPLTSKDVVFTFKLLKKFPALDVNAIWTVLKSVSAKGNRIIFTFRSPAVPFLYYIADQVFILPQHLWKSVKNPVTYADKSPVGSGPFLLHTCSPQNIIYTRNARYWQPGKPYLDEIEYPGYISNTRGNGDLEHNPFNSGNWWGAQYIPNIRTSYLNGGSTRRAWFPPQGYEIFIYPNLKRWPTSVLAVRRAISLGLDRPKVSKYGVYGYLPVASQSGVIVPNWKNWYDKSLARKYSYSYNVKKAKSLLRKAGFKMGSDGIFYDKKGKLSLDIDNIGGYTDWVGEVGVIAQTLKKVGIQITPVNLSGTTHSADEQSGNFQLSYDSPLGGPVPYYQFRQLLDSANSAPLGKTASSNYERFSSHQVDAWLNEYATTTSVKRQHMLMDKVQKVMLTQVPIIPVLEGVNWYEYDTSHLTGWVTKKDQYAAPAAYNFPDQAQVLLNLHLK